VLFRSCAASACTTETPATPLAKTPASPSFTTGTPINTGSQAAYTLAVIGDTPYGDQKLAEMPSLIALINGDPKVDLVAHLGDIKAGSSSPCTDEYFAVVRGLFDTFKDPFIYTPGDNEWTDCHVAGKNNGLYTPTERLAAVRTVFYPEAGQSLGGRKKQVLSQASDAANSTYVENVMWMESQVVFATFNVPGSNDDLASWGTPLPADAGNLSVAGAGACGARPGEQRVAREDLRDRERERRRGRRADVAGGHVGSDGSAQWLRCARDADRHARGGVRQAGADARRRLARVPGRSSVHVDVAFLPATRVDADCTERDAHRGGGERRRAHGVSAAHRRSEEHGSLLVGACAVALKLMEAAR